MSSPPASAGAPEVSLVELTSFEARFHLRSPAYWILTGLSCSIAAATVVLQTRGFPVLLPGPVVGDALRGSLQIALPLLAPFLVCAAVQREERLGVQELVLTKPPSSQTLAWARLLGALLALLLTVGAAILCGWVAQILVFGQGYSPAPVLIAGLRVLPSVLFVTGLSFAAALFVHTPMVPGLVAITELGLLTASQFLMPVLRHSLTQYHLPYSLLGLGIAALGIGAWQRGREPLVRLPASRALGAALIVAGLWTLQSAGRQWNGFNLMADRRLAPFEKLTLRRPRPLPEAPHPAALGPPIRLTQWRGRPILVAFWSASFPYGAAAVSALGRAWRDTCSEDMGFLPVCISSDPSRAADQARAAGLNGPIAVTPDWEDEAFGLPFSFRFETPPYVPTAGFIGPDGVVSLRAPLVQYPFMGVAGPCHPEWARQLYEEARLALPRAPQRLLEEARLREQMAEDQGVGR
ncbi:MAG TPA: hypothetical protein VGN26_01945 [Armatimonadota bacterium]|jgi:hypothetical protein